MTSFPPLDAPCAQKWLTEVAILRLAFPLTGPGGTNRHSLSSDANVSRDYVSYASVRLFPSSRDTNAAFDSTTAIWRLSQLIVKSNTVQINSRL